MLHGIFVLGLLDRGIVAIYGMHFVWQPLSGTFGQVADQPCACINQGLPRLDPGSSLGQWGQGSVLEQAFCFPLSIASVF